MTGETLTPDHPRYLSLKERHLITEGMHEKVVAEAGLIAHGRGEAFDYILGEKTPPYAIEQEKAAVAQLLLAKHPIISVNGNVAILCPDNLVKLAQKTNAKLEVNLFYRTEERETNIKKLLLDAGAKEILGVNLGDKAIEIPELTHKRRIVDPEGIFKADVVFVPLEDGDRTMALRKMSKKVITVDLNPMSRTAVYGNITIVNHIRRALEEMVEISDELRKLSNSQLEDIVTNFNNNSSLQESLAFMANRLHELSKSKIQEE